MTYIHEVTVVRPGCSGGLRRRVQYRSTGPSVGAP